MSDKFNWDDDSLDFDQIDELDDDSFIENCDECDCSECHAFFDEHGYVPEVDCEASRSDMIRCKCNYCDFRLTHSQINTEDAARPSHPAKSSGGAADIVATVTDFVEGYCDNLVNPAPDKIIEPKKLYITLGATAVGSILFFLLLGWLLCYCPVKTTGFTAEDFIEQFNAITSESDVNAVIEADIATINTSGSDLNVLYPSFDDLLIPEDADLEKGVLLCDGDILLKADLSGGKIRSMTLSVTEDCERYDFTKNTFALSSDADADYSAFDCYAAAGKARLAFYNLTYLANGMPAEEYVLNDAVNYGVIMENFAYYAYTVYGTYDPTLTYYEYSETTEIEFEPKGFVFSADTLQKTIIPSGNGIYKFFDGIFGEKEQTAPAAGNENATESLDSASAADAQ